MKLVLASELYRLAMLQFRAKHFLTSPAGINVSNDPAQPIIFFPSHINVCKAQAYSSFVGNFPIPVGSTGATAHSRMTSCRLRQKGLSTPHLLQRI